MFNIFRMGCGCRHDGDFVHDRPEGFEGYLMLFVKTRAAFTINGERIITEPNTFLIYDKNTPQLYEAVDNEYINDWIQFDCTESLTSGVDIRFAEPVFIGESIDISQYFRLIGDCYFRTKNKKTSGYLIKAILSEVFSAEQSPEDSSIAHYRELLDLRGRIYASPDEDWSIKRMAQLINISEPYLYRLYKKAFGVTCAADVINSRIEQAQHYLSYSKLGVEEIAFECGYKNTVHFSRQFKQLTGMSPSEWRKKNLL